ncbi:hypothetical protein BSKO_12357 [Bryopsis sp. KO-2023]|nr:hypothetical protein BSKO_12357 [Bryopsis sp. KO-2023]
MTGTFIGKVVSNKMRKSVLVAVDHWRLLPKYHRYKKFTKKFMAHDEANACNIGDTVRIQSCRPLSRHKAFSVDEILRSEKTYDVEAVQQAAALAAKASALAAPQTQPPPPPASTSETS